MKKSLAVACLLAATAALPTLLAPAEADAQETTALEFFVGKKITTKNEISIGRSKVAKGTQGTVKKVHKSGGKVVALDVQIASTTTKLSVDYVRQNFN